MGLSKKQIRAIFLVGLLIGFVGGGLAASFLNNSVPTSDGVPIGAPGGPSATLEGSGDVNLTNFWDGSTLILNTSGGNLSSTSDSRTRFHVQYSEINGTYTNVTEVEATGDNLYIEPEDKPAFNISGSPTAVNVTDMSVGDDSTDFVYESSSEFNLTVRTDATDSVQYGAIKTSDGEGLTVDIAENGGELTFTLPAGDHAIEIEQLGTLSVYNETAVRVNDSLSDDELVDDAEVELRFFSQDDTSLIVERSTSNGEIDMTGLPADQPFVVVATADGYSSRRIFVSSLLESQAIFLLPDNQTAVVQTFDLEDFTGLYPAEDTVLEIQRALNGSWRTVEGDYFGATGEFSATLRFNARHRLILTNVETGQSRNLWTYVPITSEDKSVRVLDDGTVDIIGEGVGVSFTPSVTSLPATSMVTVDVIFGDGDEDLTAYDVTVMVRNESGNFTVATASGSNPAGEELTLSFDLTNATGNVTVIANWSTSSDSGQETQVYGIRETFQNQHNLLAVLDSIPTLLPASSIGTFLAGLSIFLGVLAVVVSASVVRLSTEEAGLAGVTTLAATAMVGWLGWEVVFATSVVWVALAARRRGF